MSRKIIIMCHEPLTARIKSNFYIENFIQAGLVVEYWDVSQYVYPGIVLSEQIEEPYVIKLNTLDDIRNRLTAEDIAHSVFVVEIIECWKNRYLFQLLSDMKCYTVRIDMYGNTVLHVPFYNKILHLDAKRACEMALNKFSNFLYKHFISYNHVKGYDRIFSSSALIPNRIPINHPDYELYVESQDEEEKGSFIVFLDVFFPLHPDLSHMIKTKGISTKAYRNSLNLFFAKVEELYGLPVVIAAHPKADYTGVEFQNRQILKGGTFRLVRNAAFVLLHSSNSVSYAILNDKPFELITNKEYKSVGYLRNAQKKLAWTLGKKIRNIDNLYEDIQITKMDSQLRHDYIFNYLTSKETKDKRNKDIILSYFLSGEIS